MTDAPPPPESRRSAQPPLSPKRLERRRKRQEALRMADVSTIGTVFPVAILIGLFGGQAIGGFFGARQVGAVIGLLIGIASGFYNVYKVIQKVTPDDDVPEAGEGSEGRSEPGPDGP